MSLHIIRKVCFTAPRNCRNLYSSKKGISRDFLAKLQQPIDLRPSAIRHWYRRKLWQLEKEDQKFVPERLGTLGPDLAAAHFIVARGGAVLFSGSKKWVELNEEKKHYLPKQRVANLFVEAIDCTGSNVMYQSFDNFANLAHLKYLNLSGCKNIDDWCLDRLVMFRDTLVHLVLNGCPQITHRGISCLHKLHNLQCLELHNLPQISQGPLLTLLLEECLPNCKVEGFEYTNLSQTVTFEDYKTPDYIVKSLTVSEIEEKNYLHPDIDKQEEHMTASAKT